jgi:WD40 repeat protein
VRSLAFSADGELAALGGQDGNVRIWQLAKKEHLPGGDLQAHLDSIEDLAFTPDKQFLLTAGNDGKVKIWDVSKGSLAKLEPARTVAAHEQSIVALATSPDGKRFATIAADNTAKLWDIASGKELRSWQFKVAANFKRPFVRNLAFTPDGKYLVTANYNAALYLLECP